MADATTIDWITHDGTGLPVDRMTYVVVQFRQDDDRETIDASKVCAKGVPAWAYGEFWDHHGNGEDIVAYRVVRS